MKFLQSVFRTALNVTVYGLLLFLPAWTLNWPRAWVLLALIFVVMITVRWSVFRHDDALIAERRKPPLQRGQPAADKVLVVGFLIVFPAYIAFIPCDVFRLRLLAPPDIAVAGCGLVLAALGMLLVAVAFGSNRFAVSIVKDQTEREQTVVDSGIYRIVRHPLYAGVALVFIGSALWLGSYAAAIGSVVPLALLVARILVEERFLCTRLAGYDAYAARVRYRLIPGVW